MVRLGRWSGREGAIPLIRRFSQHHRGRALGGACTVLIDSGHR